MRSRRQGLRLSSPLAVVLLLLLAAPGEAFTQTIAEIRDSATAASPTQVTSLSATSSNRTVTATGAAAFGGEDPVEVGDDPSGDNVGGSALGGSGLDIEAMLISQPSPSDPKLSFTLDLAGLEGGGVPESAQYNWDIAVNGGTDAGGSSWSIRSSRSSQFYQPGSLEPYAGLFQCLKNPPPQPGYTCDVKKMLITTYDTATGDITIVVPLSSIGAGPGSTIDAWGRNGQPVWIRPAVAGAVNAGTPDIDTGNHDRYVVPSRIVRLGLAAPGTPEDFVSYTSQATVGPSGSFMGSVTAGSSGTWDLWARACFGANCGSRSLRVTT